jgi:hypothetical protein
MSGVWNCMPSAEAGTARSVAPTGPVVMPGAVGIPLEAVEPASAALPDPLDEPDEPVFPPLLLVLGLPLLVPVPLLDPPVGDVLPPLLLPPPAPLDVSLVPLPLPLSVVDPGSPVPVVGAALHAVRHTANASAGRATRFPTLTFNARSMTPPPTSLGGCFNRGANTNHPYPNA